MSGARRGGAGAAAGAGRTREPRPPAAAAEPAAPGSQDLAAMRGAPPPDMTAFLAPARVWLPEGSELSVSGARVQHYGDARGLAARVAEAGGGGDLVVVAAGTAALRVGAALAGQPAVGVLGMGDGALPGEVPALGPTGFGLWARGRRVEVLACPVPAAPRAPLLPAEDVALVATSTVLARELAGLTAARGLLAGTLLAVGAGGLGAGECAWGLAAHGARPPRVIGLCAELDAGLVAPLAAAARRSRVVLLAPPGRARGAAAGSEGIARALLEAYGVVLPATLEDWLECLVLLAGYDVPAGARHRVDATPGSAVDLAARAAGAPEAKPPVEVTLRALGPDGTAAAGGAGDGLVVPLVAGPGAAPAAALDKLAAAGTPALLGVWPALEAVHAAGELAARRERGLGPAPADLRGRPLGERETVARTLERALRLRPRWLSDQDSKILLKAYGITPTRQAVAQSASAAARLAGRVGMPCELRPHGHDLPSEAEGLLVVRGVRSVAEARRAFLVSAKQSPLEQALVRETPPAGVELRARAVSGGPLGAWVELAVAREGTGAPLVAAPAPLRRADAQALAEDDRILRRGRGEWDVAALGEALYRLSWLAFDLGDRVEEVRLERLLVTARGGAGAVVADARMRVTQRR